MIIDYSLPTMLAEKSLRLMHEAMCLRRFDEAVVHSREAMGHMIDAQFAVFHQKFAEETSEKRRALNQ